MVSAAVQTTDTIESTCVPSQNQFTKITKWFAWTGLWTALSTRQWWTATKLFRPIINKSPWLRLSTWASLTTAFRAKSSLTWPRPLPTERPSEGRHEPLGRLHLRASPHLLSFPMPRSLISASRGRRRGVSELRIYSGDPSTKRLLARQTCLSKTN